MSYLYETHCHTKESSACGLATADEMIAAYHQKGYRGVIITDHFFNGNTAVPYHLPWVERIDGFCLGYEKAIEAAKNLEDFDVFFGLEYGYHGTDFITLGLGADWLKAHPDIMDWSITEYFDRVHAEGGFIIHAHPFRERDYIPKIRLFTDYIDAVEGTNGGNDLERFNQRAIAYGLEHDKPITRGSDAHRTTSITGLGISLQEPAKNIHDIIDAIRKKAFK